MTSPIQILIVEDQTIVREGLCAMLATKPGLHVAGVAADGEEAVPQALRLRPDVIVMDLLMPKKGGICATREIVEALRAGAMGYVLKQDVGEELVNAIHQIHAGQSPLNPLVARRLVQSLTTPRVADTLAERLTNRELEVARLVAHGYDNQRIADALSISIRTVGTHVANILDKADVSNRTQLARLMLKQGLASLYEE